MQISVLKEWEMNWPPNTLIREFLQVKEREKERGKTLNSERDKLWHFTFLCNILKCKILPPLKCIKKSVPGYVAIDSFC